VPGDVRDRGKLSETIRRYRPEAVLHFAALAYVGESVPHPAKYFETNTADTIQLLGAMREHGSATLFFVSRRRKPGRLEIYGSDYPTRNGTCVRDYIHVWDLAQAHISALRLLLYGGTTQALNLGIGKGFTVREVVASIQRVTGLRVPIRLASRRGGDPPEFVADGNLARQVLNFQPAFTDLDPMVETAWKWYRQQSD
jgi:UDP-glucose 4-epimerase